MRLVKYLVQSMPAFLAFIIAPYFFLLGAAYDDERLRLLGLDDAGLSASGPNAIYRGFNIWANTSLVSLIERFLPLSGVALVGYALLRWLLWSKWDAAKRFKAHARLYRRKAKHSFRWLIIDTGLILAPAFGVVVWIMLIGSLLWGFRNMELGTSTANADIAKLRAAVPTCTKPHGSKSELCSTVVFPNRECVTGVVVASTPDRVAILEGSGPPTIRDNKSALRFIKLSTDKDSYAAYCTPSPKRSMMSGPKDQPQRKRRRSQSRCKRESR